jgi:hypothetical protein
MHVDDGEKKPRGIPTVPLKYQPYLLKEPIDAEVVWVGKTTILERKDRWPPGKHQVTDVRLNRGEADGLLPGMELHHAEFPRLRILDVSASSSHAEASEWPPKRKQDAGDVAVTKGPKIRLGLRYSTRSPTAGIESKESEL